MVIVIVNGVNVCVKSLLMVLTCGKSLLMSLLMVLTCGKSLLMVLTC